MKPATMPARQQFLRYVLVGLGSNAVVYLVYLLLTRWGWNPKVAMSLLYLVGVLQTFVFNKRWSFRFNGAATPALLRYVTAYAVGYLIQLFALLLLVDQMRLPHQWVMGVMIVIVAAMLFFAQRYWVFPPTTSGSTA
ncbi:MAG: GtrA family protein [Rhodoferax sp.]|nr:GtrA family protein [Rhodoferax sp.]